MNKQKNIYPLFDIQRFHDACGTGFIVAQSGKPEKRILPLALKALKRLSHRGAKSYDQKSGDGSGILTDLPKQYFKSILKLEFKRTIPKGHTLGLAMVFTNSRERSWLKEVFAVQSKASGFNILAVREVPTEEKYLGELAKKTKPQILQFIITGKKRC